MATQTNNQAKKPEIDEKTDTGNPYSNLESVFGPYVTYIEEILTADVPTLPQPIFEKTYKVKSLNSWDEKKAAEYEYGNRIIAPENDLKLLLNKGAETPIILQIYNKLYPQKISHCSVIEWTAPNGVIFVPSWMLFDFLLQTASNKDPQLTLRYYEKAFLKASFVQIQPYMLKSIQSDEFKDVQKLFELSLKKYQCLTIGDTLRIQHNKNVHLFEVTDVLSAQSIAGITPFNAVSIVETDVSVDFLAAKDAPVDKEKEMGYDVNIDPKSLPQPDDIIATTKSSDMKANEERIDDYKVNPEEIEKSFSGTGQKLDDNTAAKKKEVESFVNIKGEPIVCDNKQKTTRIQFVLIGNKREAIHVNLSTTIMQLYAHAKFVSGYEKEFQLLGGFPPKPLKDAKATVEECHLGGARVTQKAL